MLDLIRWCLFRKTRSLGLFIRHLRNLYGKERQLVVTCNSAYWRSGQFWSHDDIVIFTSNGGASFEFVLRANRGPGYGADDEEATTRARRTVLCFTQIIQESLPGVMVVALLKDEEGVTKINLKKAVVLA